MNNTSGNSNNAAAAVNPNVVAEGAPAEGAREELPYGNSNDGLGRCLTAEDLARAVMGSNEYIWGPRAQIDPPPPKTKPLSKAEFIEIIKGTKTMNEDIVSDENTSHKKAMDRLVALLSLYYPNPTYKIGGAKNLFNAVLAVEKERTGNRKLGAGHSGFQAKRNKNFIYCNNCMKLKPEIEGARYVVLGEVDYTSIASEVGGVTFKTVGVKLTQLYPHCRECTVNPNYRFNRSLTSNVGSADSTSGAIYHNMKSFKTYSIGL